MINVLTMPKRVMAAACAAAIAAACGAFATTQTAYADIVASDASGLEVMDDQAVAAQSDEEAEKARYIQRLYNPYTGEHFYTGDVDETMDLVKAGWNYEGVSWVSLPKTEASDPVYRLYNKYTGEHHFTVKEDEKKQNVKDGWTDEGLAFYAESDFDEAKTKDLEPVYREYNPNAKAFYHNFTMDKDEHDSLVSKGWKDESVAWYATAYDKKTDYATLGGTLYRLYNPYTGEHFYTADTTEVGDLVKAGWSYEKRAWTTLAKDAENAKEVYRLYNKYTGDHMFTIDADENDKLAAAGWTKEGVAFYAAPKDLANTSGYTPVYREYNPNATVAGSHNWTIVEKEHKSLVELGWKDEGVAWCGVDTTSV